MKRNIIFLGLAVVMLFLFIGIASAAIQIWIKDSNGNVVVNGVYMGSCTPSGYSETCYSYYGPSNLCSVKGYYQGRTYKNGAYSAWTNLWYCEPCGNGWCDTGETGVNCSTDCKTSIGVYPSRMYAGDKATVTVYFNDSRYVIGEDVKLSLYIDDTEWTSCAVNNMNWSSMGWDKINSFAGKYKGGSNYESSINIFSTNSYAKIVFDCIVPTNLPQGNHTLRAVPSIYSKEIVLNGDETEFVIMNNFIKNIGILKISLDMIKVIF